jgi:uncharacterized protein YjbI with pentapeptide repeats
MDEDAQRELTRALATRKTGQVVPLDLSNRDLTALQAVGADLVGATLARAVLSGASLAGARLVRANLEGADLSYCDLGGADLSEANLRHADLTGARLDDTVLAGADLRDVCLQGTLGDPLSMTGARLNKGTITRSALRMRDIAQLVVRGALVNEKPSLPVPAPTPPADSEVSIVPKMRDLELEIRHQIADLDDDVPASVRAMQRMNALIIDARPSLAPEAPRAPMISTAPPQPKALMPKSGDTFLGVLLGEVLPGSTVSRTFRGRTADGQSVLLKVFDPEAVGAALQLPAFQRGLRALCRLQGQTMPGGAPLRVAEVLAVATDLTAYVVRDYENGAISNVVDVAITLRAGLEIFRSICETVAALHREGILVRSLKPSNILIDGLTPIIGEVDMLDFPALIEVRGELCGYQSFVAPEELIGQGSRSPTADIYALGKLVDYLLTGHEPVGKVGSPPLLAGQKNAPPILVEIVRRSLAKDPADRYQYVDDLLADLDNFESRGSKATLQASIRPGALSRLTAGPSLLPVPTPKKAGAAPISRPANKTSAQTEAGGRRGMRILGLVVGAAALGAMLYLAQHTM